MTYLGPDQLTIEAAFKANIGVATLTAGDTSQTYQINTKNSFEWRWCREDGQWVPYSQDFQTQIENAFKKLVQPNFRLNIKKCKIAADKISGT